MSEVRYLVAGDSAVCVEFGNEISPEINKKIRAFKIAVEKSDIPGIALARLIKKKRRFRHTAPY